MKERERIMGDVRWRISPPLFPHRNCRFIHCRVCHDWTSRSFKAEWVTRSFFVARYSQPSTTIKRALSYHAKLWSYVQNLNDFIKKGNTRTNSKNCLWIRIIVQWSNCEVKSERRESFSNIFGLGGRADDNNVTCSRLEHVDKVFLEYPF